MKTAFLQAPTTRRLPQQQARSIPMLLPFDFVETRCCHSARRCHRLSPRRPQPCPYSRCEATACRHGHSLCSGTSWYAWLRAPDSFPLLLFEDGERGWARSDSTRSYRVCCCWFYLVLGRCTSGRGVLGQHRWQTNTRYMGIGIGNKYRGRGGGVVLKPPLSKRDGETAVVLSQVDRCLPYHII